MKQIGEVRDKVKQRIKHHSTNARRIIKEQHKKLQETQKEIHTTFIRHKIFIIGIVVLLIFAIYDYSQHGLFYKFFVSDTSQTIAAMQSYGEFSIVMYILFTVIEVVLAPIPSIVLYSAAGVLFGSVNGTLIIFVGNIIGASICYFLARYFLKSYVEQKIPRQMLLNFHKYTEKYGAFTIFFIRINPFTSSDIFSYVAGVTKIKYWPFIISTGLALLPLIFVQVYIGADIISQSELLSFMFAVVSLLYLAGLLYLLFRKKEANQLNSKE